MNRAVTSGRNEQIKSARQMYNAKVKDLKANTIIKKSTISNLQININVKGEALGIDKFSLTPRRRPKKANKLPTFAIKTIGGRKNIKGTFIAFRDGKGGLFRRTTKRRLPIKKIYTVSTPQIVGSQVAMLGFEIAFSDTFEKRFNHEFNRLLGEK